MGSRFEPYPANGGSCISYNTASANDRPLVTKMFKALRERLDAASLHRVEVHTALMIREFTQEQYQDSKDYVSHYSLMVNARTHNTRTYT